MSCLVTKLQGTVEDNSFYKLGETKILLTGSGDRELYVGSNTGVAPIVLKTEGENIRVDGALFDTYVVDSVGKTVYILDGVTEVRIENYYNIRSIKANNTVFPLEVVNYISMPRLFVISNGVFDIGKLPTSLIEFSVYNNYPEYGIPYGNIEDFTTSPAQIVFYNGAAANLTGNLETYLKKRATKPTMVAIAASQISGNIAEIVKYVDIGDNTLIYAYSCPNIVGTIEGVISSLSGLESKYLRIYGNNSGLTYNGQRFNRATITWDASGNANVVID